LVPVEAIGVAQFRAHVSRLGVFPLNWPALIPFWELPAELAAGVGYCERE
jgi:hypothetical protein